MDDVDTPAFEMKVNWPQIIRIGDSLVEWVFPIKTAGLGSNWLRGIAVSLFGIILLTMCWLYQHPLGMGEQEYFSGGKIIAGDRSPQLWSSYLGIMVSSVVICWVMAAYIVDIGQRLRLPVMGARRGPRKIYVEIFAVFAGYLMRMFVFSFAALLGVKSCNYIAVVITGHSVFKQELNLVLPQTLWDAVFFVFQQPVPSFDVTYSGLLRVDAFLLVMSFARWLMVTFLFGLFYAMMPSPRESGEPK